MRLIRNQFALGLSVAVGISLLQVPSLAGSYHSEAIVYGAAESHDDQFDGHVLWMRFEHPGDGTESGCTAVMVNEWFAITSAHCFTVEGIAWINHVVGDGDNYQNNPGHSYVIADYGEFPDWSGQLQLNGEFYDEIDLAWFKLDTPIAGAGLPLGVAAIDDILTVVEFGRPATGSGGFLPIDGERRAFDLVVDQFGQANAWSTAYFASDFFPLIIRNIPLAGISTSGTSGSPCINSVGEVVGIVSGSFNTPNYGGLTGSLNLTAHHGWILANTQSVLDCPGDADGSRVVDMRDFASVQQTFGQLGAMFSDGDFDHDDDIDFDDAMILFDEMGMECP